MPLRSSPSAARRTFALGVTLAVAGTGLVLLPQTAAQATPLWSAPIPIYLADTSGGQGGGAYSPSLSADGKTVAFQVSDGSQTYKRINVADFNGATWDSSIQVSPDAAKASTPDIAGGGGAVVFPSTTSSVDSAAGAKKLSGAWTPQSETLFGSNSTRDVTVSADGGRVAWKNYDAESVVTATWDAAGNPGTPVTIESGDPNNCACFHEPIVAGNGQAIAYEKTTNNDAATVARLVDGVWTPATVSNADTAGSVAISADGNAVVWLDDDTDFIYGSTWNGSGWTTPVSVSGTIVPESFGSDGYSAVVADGSVMWKDEDTGAGYVAQFRNGTWQEPQEFAPSFNLGDMSDDGTAIVYKPDNDGRPITVANYANGQWSNTEVVVASGVETDRLRMAGDGQSVAWTANYIENQWPYNDLMYSRITTPSVPKGVHATAAANSAVVDWSPAAEGMSAVTGYEVAAYFENNLVTQTCSSVAPALTCTVPGLEPGKTYTFKVRALSAQGNSAYSDFSNPVQIPENVTPATAVEMTFVDVPRNVVIGQRVRWNLEVDFIDATRAGRTIPADRAARPNGSANVYLRGTYQCTAQIVNGRGSCVGTIPSLGEMKLTATFLGTGDSAGAEAAAKTKTNAATVSISKGK